MHSGSGLGGAGEESRIICLGFGPAPPLISCGTWGNTYSFTESILGPVSKAPGGEVGASLAFGFTNS